MPNIKVIKECRAAENILEAWRLRSIGYTITQIARRLKVSRPTVQGYMNRVKEELEADRQKLGLAYFEGEIAVTDKILKELMGDLKKSVHIDYEVDDKGKRTRVNVLHDLVDTNVANSAIKCLDLRAKYFGLYKNTKEETKDPLNLLNEWLQAAQTIAGIIPNQPKVKDNSGTGTILDVLAIENKPENAVPTESEPK